MLRLKQALKECGINQQAVCRATGFSKTQVSLTLSTGKMPVGAEKFRDGVIELAERTDLDALMKQRGMTVDQLFEVIEEPGKEVKTDAQSELDTALINYAGRVALGQSLNSKEMLTLIRISRHLLFRIICLMSCVPDLKDRFGEIDDGLKAILAEE